MNAVVKFYDTACWKVCEFGFKPCLRKNLTPIDEIVRSFANCRPDVQRVFNVSNPAAKFM